MADKTSKTENAEIEEAEETPKPTCGIVMPIAAMENYTADHWSDIKQILLDVIESAGFTGSLVSDAEETSIIQKTIVQNVYNNDVVICDISGKNPNVMFELGMRLAFDKATIVIKDFDTGFSFDTSPIEHLLYPRDLRFQSILDFKDKLKSKILATYKKSKSDPSYSTFLKSFGEFKVAHLESKEVSADEFIIESLKELKSEIKRLSKTDDNRIALRSSPVARQSRLPRNDDFDSVKLAIITIGLEDSAIRLNEIVNAIRMLGSSVTIREESATEDGAVISAKFDPPIPKSDWRFVVNHINEKGIQISWKLISDT